MDIGKSILVVDDNPDILKLIHHLLGKHGYLVHVAATGEMALSFAESSLPDLILLDISMPDEDGYSICGKLKKNPHTQHIPVIFVSAMKDSVDIVKGFNIGAIDFITKPFEEEVLLTRLKTHLTVNHLQKKLFSMNNALEKNIQVRTKQIVEANAVLVEEMEKRSKTEYALRQSENFHRLTLENLGKTIVITTDENGVINYFSPNISEMLGYSVDEIHALQHIQNVLNIPSSDSSSPQDLEIDVKTKDGVILTLHMTVKEAHINSPMVIYTCQDITETKAIRKKFVENANRLKYALSVSNEGIWDWDLVADKIVYNATFFTMLGYSEETTRESLWFDLLHPDDHEHCQKTIDDCISGQIPNFHMEYRLKEKNGKYLWVMSNGKIVEYDQAGKPNRFVGTHTNIDLIKESEHRLRYLASYDSLTNLPNKGFFIDTLKNAIARTQQASCRHAILFLDLDRFKTINESLGHSAGDILLKEISKRLYSIVRDVDLVARLGGDEFTVFLENISSREQVIEIANKIIEISKRSFNLLGNPVGMTPSIGIVFYPEHGNTPEDLLKKADTAMYHSKHQGGGCYTFFSDEMEQAANVQMEIETNLRSSIKNKEIIQYYQPKLRLDTGDIAGLESLVRWRHNDAMIPPGKFIGLAEETGLIVPMGELILKNTLQHTRAWIEQGLLKSKISVNISAVQFRQEDILQVIDRCLSETQFPTEYLELELTEAVVMSNTDNTFQKMRSIKERGIALALDDFGTGYSSLSYLKKFPIDCLKIDMSFIKDMQYSDKNKNIIKAIIDLAHVLGLEVVAEGVETNVQLVTLKDMGCDLIQGYIYSKALDQQATKLFLQGETQLYT